MGSYCSKVTEFLCGKIKKFWKYNSGDGYTGMSLILLPKWLKWKI